MFKRYEGVSPGKYKSYSSKDDASEENETKNDFIKKEAQEYLENFMRPIKGTISGEVKR